MLSTSPATNLGAIVKEYVDRMLPVDGSMKVLLLDSETMSIISVAYSQSQLLSHGVFLIDTITNQKRQAMPTMRCVCFVRPTKDSIAAVAEEVKAARYQSYAIILSSALSTESLDILARNDHSELVNRVEELFADTVTINSDFFTIPLSPHELTSNFIPPRMSRRAAEGLAALCVAMRRKPHIRFQRSSEYATRIANELVDVFRSDAELYDFKPRDTVLLVMDRSEDPVTALLTPWTYQAMLHELVGLDLNRMLLPGAKADEGYVFSQADDQFFAANMFNNWGEICESVKAYVDQCKKTLNIDRSTATIEEVKQFMQKLPQTKAMTGSVTKHATVVSHLSTIIKTRGLLEVSLLEQDIVATSNQSEHWARLVDIAKKASTDPIDTLRLCLIYNLRYEKPGTPSRTDELLNGTPHQTTVRKLRKYYGDRPTDQLFAASGMMASVVSFVKGMSEEGNIYTQHEPVLKKHLVALSQGKLSTDTFPYLVPSGGIPGVFKPKEVIVFICGGCTFEEAALIHSINAGTGQKTSSGDVAKPIIAGDMKVVLGGTATTNTRSFIEELERY